MKNNIEIIKGYTPVEDSRANKGKVKLMKNKEIIKYFNDDSIWTDDEYFIDKYNNIYYIDSLIGKEIKISNTIIKIK